MRIGTADDAAVSARHVSKVTAAVTAAFVLQLDNAIVNLALPAMRTDLGLDLTSLEWVVSGYMITFASLLLIGGRIADRAGLRATVIGGLAVFTASSLVAALSPTGAVLLVARVVQGVGAAVVAPTTFTVVSTTFEDNRRRRHAVGAWGTAMSLALVAGPPVGGFLTAAGSWRLIFLINLPIGLALLGLVAWSYRSDSSTQVGRLELVPSVLATVTVGGLVFAVIEGARLGWTHPAIVVAFVVATGSAVAFVRSQHAFGVPLVNFGLLRGRVFGMGTAALAAWSMGMFGIASYTSIYLQNVVGMTSSDAGLMFLPFAGAMAVTASCSGAVAERMGTRAAVTVGFTLNAAALWCMIGFSADTSTAGLAMPLLVLGVGAGLTMPLHAEIGASLPEETTGSASALLSLVRETASLMGVAVLGAIIAAETAGATGGAAYLDGFRGAAGVAAGTVTLGGVLALVSLCGPRLGKATE